MQVLIGWNCFQRTSPDFEKPKSWNSNHPKKPHDRHFSCVNACRLVDWGSMFPPFLSHFGLAPQTSSLGLLDDFGTPISAWFKGWNPKGFDKNTDTQRHIIASFYSSSGWAWDGAISWIFEQPQVFTETERFWNGKHQVPESPWEFECLDTWILKIYIYIYMCLTLYVHIHHYLHIHVSIYIYIHLSIAILYNIYMKEQPKQTFESPVTFEK